MAAKIGASGKQKFDLGQNADINVTPFVDVMLVLLIIFMVAAPLATVSIRLDLPPAAEPPPSEKKIKPVFINVQPGGKVLIVDQESSLSTLSSDLGKAMIEANPDVTNPQDERVMIRANRVVPYSQFMDVLNELQRTGFFKIGLISEDL